MTQRELLIDFLSDYFGVENLDEIDVEKIDDYLTSIAIKSNTDLEYNLPSAEHIKRWYQLLVGIGEEEMHKDMKQLCWFIKQGNE
ncbi:MAG: hypothetical protein PHU98_06335 [Mariniphaga sp.]|nr:hypothetical protein [Mariniphaga sp.]